MNPVVSIIIPCHNDHHRLPYALASFRRQVNAPSYEIIVVDDNSRPNVRGICHSHGVRYIRIEAGNANSARNHGITHAKGSILVFFDADNVALPQFLSLLCAPILLDRADVAYGRSELIGDTNVYTHTPFNHFLARYEDLKMGNMIDTACAVRRSILTEAPWDPTIDRSQDWDFHLTRMEQGARYAYIPDTIYQYWIPTGAQPKRFQSYEIRSSGRDLVRYKHHLDTSGTALITLALPTAGRYYSVPQWLACIRQLDFPTNQLNLQFLDHSNDQTFFEELLLPFVTRHQHEYAGINIIAQRAPKLLGNPQRVVEEDSQGRTKLHAENMRILSRMATTPYIFFLEDDTLCPPDTLQRLLPQLMTTKKAGAIQGIERSRVVKYSIGAWRFRAKDALPQNLFFERQTTGTTAVDAGGFFCLLAHASVVKQCPFPTSHTPQGGPDIAFGWWLKQRGLEWLTDWSIACDHITHADDGRTVALHPTTTNEPSSLFLRDWLPDDQYAITPTTYQPAIPQRQNPALRPTLVLHHVTDESDVMRYLSLATIRSGDTRAIYLIAIDDTAHTRLQHSQFPPGTVLIGVNKNCADYLNELLTQPTSALIIADARTVPCSHLLDHALYVLARGGAAHTAVTHTHEGVVWSGGWYDAHHNFWSDVPSPTSFPILNPALCILHQSRIATPLFEPRAHGTLADLLFAASLELAKRGQTISHSNTPYSTTQLPRKTLAAIDYFTLGIVYGLYIPIRRMFGFLRHLPLTAWPQFLAGLGSDCAMRVYAPRKRHFRSL